MVPAAPFVRFPSVPIDGLAWWRLDSMNDGVLDRCGGIDGGALRGCRIPPLSASSGSLIRLKISKVFRGKKTKQTMIYLAYLMFLLSGWK
jgi:hypothetical protein